MKFTIQKLIVLIILATTISLYAESEVLPWFGQDLVQSRSWKAKINIKCVERGKSCGTIDFRSLNCGGKLSFLRKSSDFYIFHDQIRYGRCVQNCEIHVKRDGSSYKEYCKDRYTGGGKLQQTRQTNKASSHSKKSVNKKQNNKVGSHLHAGKQHKHPLPKQGIKHRHGSGAIGIVLSKNRIAKSKSQFKNIPKPSENNTNQLTGNGGHFHSGRKHNHPLPKQGIRHRHGNEAYGVSTSSHITSSNKASTQNQNAPKPSGGKDVIITHGKNSISVDSKYVLRDQHGCLHYNEKINEYKKGYNSIKKSDVFSVVWHGRCKGGYPYGKGKRMWYINGKIKNSYTQYFKYRTIGDQRTKLYNVGVRIHNRKIKDRKTAQKDAKRKAKQLIVDKDLMKFVKKYNFHSLISNSNVNADWYPDDSSRSGVNGMGTIELNLKRSHTASARITGNFKNGRLINNAKLKVYASKCYKRGWLLCKVSEDDSSTTTITTSSNIKKYINNAIDTMLPGMDRRASREIARLNRKSSSYSSSSSNTSYCGDNDTCYSNMEKRTSSSYGFTCTKGTYKGSNKCVSYDSDPNIKNPYGECGVPYSYQYKTLHKAANGKCR